MPDTPQIESWDRWANHVLITLKSLSDKVDALDKSLNDDKRETQIELAVIKTRAGLIGTAAGGLVGAIVSVVVGLAIAYFSAKNEPPRMYTPPPTPPAQHGQLILPPTRDDFANMIDKLLGEEEIV